MNEQAIADAVAAVIERLVAPLVYRVKAIEADAGLAMMDRAATGAILGEIADLKKTAGDLRERVAVVEARPPIEGPPGPPGPPGADGADGAPGLDYQGVFVEGKSYARGAVVTWAGSAWCCTEATTAKPGDGAAWRLLVKRGRDGKDLR